MAEGKPGTRRVELVDTGAPTRDGMPGYIGVGLLGGVVLGFAPLRDAVQGNGPFEDAMVRFVACLLVCLVAASVLGRLLDDAPPEGPTTEGDAEGASSADPDDAVAEQVTN
jgi:hypothetical protein